MAGQRSILEGLQGTNEIRLVSYAFAGTAASYTIWNANADDYYRVVDSWVVKTNGAGGAQTLAVNNGTSAITDAMDINDADTTISRATQINDANYLIVPGGTLGLTLSTSAGNAGIVFIVLERYTA